MFVCWFSCCKGEVLVFDDYCFLLVINFYLFVRVVVVLVLFFYVLVFGFRGVFVLFWKFFLGDDSCLIVYWNSWGVVRCVVMGVGVVVLLILWFLFWGSEGLGFLRVVLFFRVGNLWFFGGKRKVGRSGVGGVKLWWRVRVCNWKDLFWLWVGVWLS